MPLDVLRVRSRVRTSFLASFWCHNLNCGFHIPPEPLQGVWPSGPVMKRFEPFFETLFLQRSLILHEASRIEGLALGLVGMRRQICQMNLEIVFDTQTLTWGFWLEPTLRPPVLPGKYVAAIAGL